MLDFKAQADLARASTEMVCAVAAASAQAMTASASQSLSLWSQLLRSPSRQPARVPASRATGGLPGALPVNLVWDAYGAGWDALVRSAQPWTLFNPSSAAWPRWPAPTFHPFAWTLPATSPWTMAGWLAWSGMRDSQAMWTAHKPTPPAPRAEAATDAVFSSYRSPGGHATAQVVMAPMNDLMVAGLAAMTAFAHTHAMLGAWRRLIGT